MDRCLAALCPSGNRANLLFILEGHLPLPAIEWRFGHPCPLRYAQHRIHRHPIGMQDCRSRRLLSIYIMADEIGHPPRVRRLFPEEEKIDAYERIDNHRIL